MPKRGQPSKTGKIKRALKRKGMSETRARKIAAATRRKSKMKRQGISKKKASKQMAKSAAKSRKRKKKYK